MKASFYESDITPPLGCYMPGEHYPIFAHDVYDKIYSKALVIEQDGQYAVIIAVDMVEFPDTLFDCVTARIQEYTGISPDRVSITSTHAHCGAPVEDSPYLALYSDKSYVSVFNRLVADSAILAFRRLDTATVSFGSAITEKIANSRCWIYDDGKIKTGRPNLEHAVRPISEIDTELTALFFERDGKKIGAVINFPCHQDTVYGDPALPGEAIGEYAGHSGDMASIISNKLKEEYGSDFVSLFLIGPSGDVACGEPYPTENSRGGSGHVFLGGMLADYVKKASKSTVEISGKLSILSEDIVCAKRKLSREELYDYIKKYLGDSPEKMNLFNLNLLMSYYFCDREDEKTLKIKVISIGDFALYVYPGEIFSVYGLNTKRNSPFKYNMVAEQSNGLGGYIPTMEAFSENSELYEIAPSYCSFAAPETGDILYEHIMKLAKSIKQ